MTLKHYTSNGTTFYYKIITGKPKGKPIELGIAFRTADSPVGYLPFYDVNDFDFSGETSRLERIMARLPMDLSAAGSPHTALIKAAASDLDFLGSGNGDMIDIQQLVRRDLVGHAMASAAGVFVDGIMMVLGGPTIKTLVSQFIKGKAKQFVVSKAISSSAKQYLKEQANVDTGRLRGNAP